MAHDGVPRYAPPEEVIRLARETGFTTRQIVRILTGCLTHQEAFQRAKVYAPLLGIAVREFMELRRNR